MEPTTRAYLYNKAMQLLRLTYGLIGATLLTACSSIHEVPGVYRIDVQQGNVIDEDMLQRLELGMPKRKVRFILGTPLLSDAFHPNRWDYVYTYKEGWGGFVQRNISIFFEDDVLAKVTGDIKLGAELVEVPKRHDQIVKVEGPGEGRGLLSGLTNPFERDLDEEPHKRKSATWTRETLDQETNGSATESSERVWQRLTTPNHDGDEDGNNPIAIRAAVPNSEDGPPPAKAALDTKPDDSTDDQTDTDASKQETSQANAEDTGESGGIFSRIRDRFNLPEGAGEFITIKPPPEDENDKR